MLDDQADLVDVADERDARAAAGVDGRERIAERVSANLCDSLAASRQISAAGRS